MTVNMNSNQYRKNKRNQKKAVSPRFQIKQGLEVKQIEKMWLQAPKLLQKAIQNEMIRIKKQEMQHKAELKKLNKIIQNDIRILNAKSLPKTAREKQQQKNQKKQQVSHLKQHRAMEKMIGKLHESRRAQLEKQAKFEVISNQIKLLEKTWRNYLPKSHFKEVEGRTMALSRAKKTASSRSRLSEIKSPSILNRVIDTE